jgi:hypothetical protein
VCNAYAEEDYYSLYIVRFLKVFLLDYDKLATGSILKQNIIIYEESKYVGDITLEILNTNLS